MTNEPGRPPNWPPGVDPARASRSFVAQPRLAVNVGDLERLEIELSATKYCTVTANLASGVAEIRHAYIVRDAAGEEHYGEVVVTGPNESPDTLGRRSQAAAIRSRRPDPAPA